MSTQTTSSNKENYETIQKLSKLKWQENKAYLQEEEHVWFSDTGRLYIRDTSSKDVEYNQELKYLEGRFNPDTLATGEKVDKLVERILGN